MRYLIIILLAFCFGCSSGAGVVPSEPPTYDFTGRWLGTFTGSGEDSIFIIRATQNENIIVGELKTPEELRFSVDGSAGSDFISLTVTYLADTSYKIYCYGTCDGVYASGTWNDTMYRSGDWTADTYPIEEEPEK